MSSRRPAPRASPAATTSQVPAGARLSVFMLCALARHSACVFSLAARQEREAQTVDPSLPHIIHSNALQPPAAAPMLERTLRGERS